MARLFGTDGVRGVANSQLTPELAFALGEAAVLHLGKRIVIGRDTRRSGEMLEAALVAGITSAGGDALLVGIVPTPAVALNIRTLGADGGVVISASHNPPEYNGIKLFDSGAHKLSDQEEERIEDFVLDPDRAVERGMGDAVGRVIHVDDAAETYVAHAVETVVGSLDGLKVVVDCGHGAAYQTTPEALRRLGADVTVINDDFDGSDINVECGSTHLEPLRAAVARVGADVGIAHDGDADRMLAVSSTGAELDGDVILAIVAADLKERGLLAKNEVVSTVMCNLGFMRAMRERDIEVVQTKVGDRYVLERMQDDGATLGGEQSGHVIFLDHNTTGDGLITALQLLDTVVRSEQSFDEAASVMQRFPQHLINVEVSRKQDFDTDAVIAEAIAEEDNSLGDDGRVLVRPSGTEPLVRVMVEAADDATTVEVAERLAAVVREQLA